MYVCILSTQGGQKEASDLPELEKLVNSCECWTQNSGPEEIVQFKHANLSLILRTFLK